MQELPYPTRCYGAANRKVRGRRYDEETGLYFYRARAYSSGIGRFLQTDPIGTKGGINLYAYTGNDPVNQVDPTGHASNGYYPNTWDSDVSGTYLTRYGQVTDDRINASYALEGLALFGAGPLAEYLGAQWALRETVASQSMVTMENAAYNYGSIGSVAGYDIGVRLGL